MRLATIQTPDGPHAAVADADHWLVLSASDVGDLLRDPQWPRAVRAQLAKPGRDRVAHRDARFGAPVPRPGKVLCCGLNYLDHIRETGREVPAFPTLFAKFADTLTAPDAEIRVTASSQVDWEAELTVVIGREIKDATRDEAGRAILGYTVANDVSLRDWQSRTLQWLQGKAFDATCPVGPVVVTADEFDPSEGARITCTIDGRVVQDSTVDRLAFDSADLVAYVSTFTRLQPGDLILTGTPGGVGLGRTPRQFLADGQELVTRIEGIGELRNRIRLISPTPQEPR